MPNVLIAADMHLDAWAAQGLNALDLLDFNGVDALIIAGDLTNKPKVRWKQAFAQIGERIALDRVWLIPGNHDYYDFRLDGDDRLASIAHEAGAHFAQKMEIVLGATRYLCCTLWTDFALGGGSAEANAGRSDWEMNDFRYIRVARHGYRKARPSDTIAVHHDHLAWLRKRLSAPFSGRTVVVTHHAPHPAALPPGAPLPWFYASDLTNFIEEFQPDEWAFGHTHHPTEFRIGRTLLRNVSMGYPGEIR